MPYLFTPPSIPRPVGADRLWSRFHYQVGQALLKKDGFYTLAEVVASEDVFAADITYLGGHVYPISDAEAADLQTAGYGDWVSVAPPEEPPIDPGNPPTDPPEYGLGAYGAGIFGS